MNDAPAFDFNKVRMAGVMRDIRFLGYCHGGVHLWRFPETCVSLNRVSHGAWTPGRPFDAQFHAFCPIDEVASMIAMTDSLVPRWFCCCSDDEYPCAACRLNRVT